MDQSLSPDIKKYLEDLQQGSSYGRRDAARKLGELSSSNAEIVIALMMAKEEDIHSEVREVAAQSLLAPVHQAIIQQCIDFPSKLAEVQTQRENQRKRAAMKRSLRRLAIVMGILAGIVVGLWALGFWVLVVEGRPEIKTSDGTLVITKAYLGDRFPPGCTSSSSYCYYTYGDSRILVVRIEGKDKGDIYAQYELIDNVYLVAENGSEVGGLIKEWDSGTERIFLLFKVEDSERHFKLIYPDNPPIDLKPILFLLP
jgi:hypothetical protein